MSEKCYPSRFMMIIAEDLRSEGGDKFSIMGVVPSGLAVMQQGEHLIIPSLAIYANFYEVYGEFNSRLIVENDGNKIFDTALPHARLESQNEDGKSNFLFAAKFMNVKVTKADTLTVTLRLDDRDYTQKFNLSLADKDED